MDGVDLTVTSAHLGRDAVSLYSLSRNDLINQEYYNTS